MSLRYAPIGGGAGGGIMSPASGADDISPPAPGSMAEAEPAFLLIFMSVMNPAKSMMKPMITAAHVKGLLAQVLSPVLSHSCRVWLKNPQTTKMMPRIPAPHAHILIGLEPMLMLFMFFS